MTACKTYVLHCNLAVCSAVFMALDEDTVGGVRRRAAAEGWTHGAVRAANGTAWASGDWCPTHGDHARQP
ncbi:MAG: hypothetical protein IPJ61_19840 [Tessaracoccus sp.]|uniref:hypothetical protein n=1 Tax=Tessaracoccus sp. TaxID=1971211 RepID=UPI001ED23737|nr:hypothetical protein [Tessaracoccus sp.]MBK7823239.1 hypothetical protein [Tessaracoccus sp.]